MSILLRSGLLTAAAFALIGALLYHPHLHSDGTKGSREQVATGDPTHGVSDARAARATVLPEVDLAQIGKEARAAGDSELATRLQELELRKRDHESLSQRYGELRSRLAEIEPGDPKGKAARLLNAEVDSVLQQMRENAERIGKLTGEASDRYVSGKLAQMGVTP